MEKRSVKEWVKRYVFCALGLFISALGVAFTRIGELGVSQVSSVANVLSIKFPFLTLGNWLILWNCLLILLQILILRKNFKIIQLFLQLIVSFLFGYFTDFGVWLFSAIPVSGESPYVLRIITVLIGTALVAFGICFNVIASAVMNAGESFVRAISDTSHKDFGTLKIIVDVSFVVISVVLSLVFFQGQLIGVREGTVIAALLTGFLIKIFVKPLRPGLTKFIEAN